MCSLPLPTERNLVIAMPARHICDCVIDRNNMKVLHFSGRIWGKEADPPVLCVHGRSDNLETFTNLIPHLPRKYCYICIDLPGHGKSSKVNAGFILDILWYSMCVKRVIDHFKWKKLTYLGHSLGGMIGIFLAGFYPESIEKLIVLDNLILGYTPPSRTAHAIRKKLIDSTLKLEQRLGSSEGPVYSISDFVGKMKDFRKTEVSDEEIQLIAERNLTKLGHNQYRYTNDQRVKLLGGPVFFTIEQLENIVSAVVCPTLVILGRDSIATMPHIMLKFSPLYKNKNIHFEIIDGDHDVHLAHPQEVSRLIYFFLTGEHQSKL